MKSLKRASLWTGVALVAMSSVALAHSGRTNSEGCHNDRSNGTYHCHRGSSASSSPASPRPTPSTPVRSLPSSKTPQVPQIYYPSSTPNPMPAPQQSPSPASGAQFYFSSCDQAHSIGKTVLRTVEEGYRPELDRNRNGIACEPADTL